MVLGVDLSREALALAGRIVTGWASTSSWCEGISANRLRGTRVDALVSNPPYLTSGEYEVLDRSVRDWEPEAGPVRAVPMAWPATRRLVTQARDVVRAGGLAGLEVDCSRAPAVAGLAPEAGWVDVSIYEDLFGRARYVLARRSETA